LALRICHVSSSASRVGAGVGKALRDCVATQASHGHDVTVLTLNDYALSDDWAPLAGKAALISCEVSGFSHFGFSVPFFQAARTVLPDADIVHIHGLWMFPNWATGRVARRHAIPCILSPHGMLAPWSLEHSKWKKRFIAALFEGRNITKAACIHACSNIEAESIRRYGYTGPIGTVPLGLNSHELENARRWSEYSPAQLSLPEGKRIALFFSRLHVVKGVENLLRAWARISKRFPEWQLVIAGYGHPEYISTLHSLTESLGISRCVTFHGPAFGEDKWKLIGCSELLLLPSFTENFGMVVIEALAASVPVITTKGAPWEDLEAHNCGWWIDVGVDPMVEILRNVLALSPSVLKESGIRGVELVRHKYSSEENGQMMLELYLSLKERHG
jgi:glycosyltransferase involved in cell wall biosynthesis